MTSTTNNNTSQNGLTLDAHRDLFQEFGFSTLLEQTKQDLPPTFKSYISHLPGNLDEVINSQVLAKKFLPLEDPDIEAELQMSLKSLLSQTFLPQIQPINFQTLDENQLRGFVLQPGERKRKHKHRDGADADKKQKKKVNNNTTFHSNFKKKKDKKDKKQKEKKEKKDKKDKKSTPNSVKSQYSSPSGSSYTNSPFTPSPMLNVQEQTSPSPLVSITTNTPMQF